jgi:hypothetical protein
MYDVQQKKLMAEIVTPEIKFVYWSHDPKAPCVALVGKDSTFSQ